MRPRARTVFPAQRAHVSTLRVEAWLAAPNVKPATLEMLRAAVPRSMGVLPRRPSPDQARRCEIWAYQQLSLFGECLILHSAAGSFCFALPVEFSPLQLGIRKLCPAAGLQTSANPNKFSHARRQRRLAF